LHHVLPHAQMLLALDEIPGNADWTDKKIAKAYASNEKSAGDLRRRFVEQGFVAPPEFWNYQGKHDCVAYNEVAYLLCEG